MTWPNQHPDIFSHLDPLPDCWSDHTMERLYKETGEPTVAECVCGRRWRLSEEGSVEVQRRGYL